MTATASLCKEDEALLNIAGWEDLEHGGHQQDKSPANLYRPRHMHELVQDHAVVQDVLTSPSMEDD